MVQFATVNNVSGFNCYCEMLIMFLDLILLTVE